MEDIAGILLGMGHICYLLQSTDRRLEYSVTTMGQMHLLTTIKTGTWWSRLQPTIQLVSGHANEFEPSNRRNTFGHGHVSMFKNASSFNQPESNFLIRDAMFNGYITSTGILPRSRVMRQMFNGASSFTAFLM